MQLDNVWVIEDFKNVDFIDESCIILQLFLLNSFNGILFVAFTMLGQVHDAKSAICQLLLK